MRFIVKELQNRQSDRAGVTWGAANLTQAKRIATHSQIFQGTVLRIEAESGKLISEKINGKWRDSPDGVLYYRSEEAAERSYRQLYMRR